MQDKFKELSDYHANIRAKMVAEDIIESWMNGNDGLDGFNGLTSMIADSLFIAMVSPKCNVCFKTISEDETHYLQFNQTEYNLCKDCNFGMLHDLVEFLEEIDDFVMSGPCETHVIENKEN